MAHPPVGRVDVPGVAGFAGLSSFVPRDAHPACDVIVLDDVSSDGSAQLLRERYGEDPRVTLVCQDNGGQLSAFLAGLRHAHGDNVCFLDSDDHWSPEYLHKLAQAYASGGTDFIISDMQVFDQESRSRLGGRKAGKPTTRPTQ